MRITVAAIAINQVVSQKSYQRDAPDGRWLEGEHGPSFPRSSPSSDSRVACPNSFSFCIDTRWSDARTCIYPNPHLIKRCYDEGCIRSDFGQDRITQGLPDTYCKDFMDVEGRFCQWTEQVRCTCTEEDEDIVYANSVVVAAGNPMPEGYRTASECIYPTNNLKRMPNGAYVDVPVPGKPSPPPIPNDAKLQGDLNWVDPNAPTEEPTTTRKPAPMKNKQDSSGAAASSTSFLLIAAVIAALL